MKTLSSAQPNILLVDDNQDGLLVRRSLLEEAGCMVAVARDGEEGLKVFKNASFDVVVTDYRMPRMNGAELIQGLRRVNPTVRVILLSGFVEPLGLTEENTGADVVIPKNANEPAHLLRWVKRLARRAALRKPPAAQKHAMAQARANSQ